MTTEKKRKFIIDFVYLALILALSYLLLRYALPLLMPFALAFLIAYLLRRPIRYVGRRTMLGNGLAAVFLVVLVYGGLGLAVALLGLRAAAAVAGLIQRFPHFYAVYVVPTLSASAQWLENLLARADPAVLSALEEISSQLFQMLGQLVSSVSVWVTGWVSSVAGSLPGLLIRLLFMVISTFFIAIDYDRIVGFFSRLIGGHTRQVLVQVKNYVVGTLFVCIRSYLLIMCITFAELAVGLRIIGVDRSTLVALLIAIFDILPVLGTGGIMIPWALITALSGNLPRALALFVLYLVITVIRNIIEPKIVGKQIGLHPVLTLMSMFVGTHFFGVVGLFGLPILLSLLRYLNETGAIHLYPVAQAEGTQQPEPEKNSPAGD